MRAQYPNSEPNMIMLLTAELVRIIVNSGATSTPSETIIFEHFSDFGFNGLRQVKNSILLGF